MTAINLRDDFPVELVQHVGSDEMICNTARVSTLGAAVGQVTKNPGLINFLMKGRHGSPFEHGSMTFRIQSPIFVWREFMRHRVGFSYNEESGRYRELQPDFYLPGPERPLQQIGKAGQYRFVSGTYEQHTMVRALAKIAYRTSWLAYKGILKVGVAKEVARIVLPVGIYSTAYVTCNPRSLMHFLSLRTKDMESLFPSFPQWEIERVARAMEAIFADLYPDTHAAWNTNGRVAP